MQLVGTALRVTLPMGASEHCSWGSEVLRAKCFAPGHAGVSVRATVALHLPFTQLSSVPPPSVVPAAPATMGKMEVSRLEAELQCSLG